MVIKQTECVEELLSVMLLFRRFRIQLPHTNRIYNPLYSAAVYLTGDIVVFTAKEVHPNSYFIAHVTGKVVKGLTAHYDVVCIPRGKNRDIGNKVNWLTKTSITSNMILCKLRPELK